MIQNSSAAADKIQNSQQGFTLIELLVVIAIIANGANVLWADLHVECDRWSFLVSGKAIPGFTTSDYYFMPK